MQGGSHAQSNLLRSFTGCIGVTKQSRRNKAVGNLAPQRAFRYTTIQLELRRTECRVRHAGPGRRARVAKPPSTAICNSSAPGSGRPCQSLPAGFSSPGASYECSDRNVINDRDAPMNLGAAYHSTISSGLSTHRGNGLVATMLRRTAQPPVALHYGRVGIAQAGSLLRSLPVARGEAVLVVLWRLRHHERLGAGLNADVRSEKRPRSSHMAVHIPRHPPDVSSPKGTPIDAATSPSRLHAG